MKILVVCRTLKQGGGISEWILNYYRELAKKTDVSIDLLVEEKSADFTGINIPQEFNIINIHSLKSNFFGYLSDWYRISQKVETDYDYVHIHLDNFVRVFYLLFLKNKNNIILHSHNSYNDDVTNSFIKRCIHNISKQIVKHGRFIRFACSDLAAAWLFDEAPYKQINNGVNLLDFQYNGAARAAYRKKLNLIDKTVYGHVGRFVYQKNQQRLVKIFAEIYKSNRNSVLLLVGTGAEQDKVKQLVNELGLEEVVYFLGHHNDVAQLLNALDFIIFPSRYEGLPIALVEAQANGIPVFYSDSITKEVELLPTSFAFSLHDNDIQIAQRILQAQSLLNRKSATAILKAKGYDRNDVVEKLYHFYKQD